MKEWFLFCFTLVDLAGGYFLVRKEMRSISRKEEDPVENPVVFQERHGYPFDQIPEETESR